MRNTDFTLDNFESRCVTTLTCEMCGEQLAERVESVWTLATMAHEKGWRFQNDQVVCAFCKDGQR